MVLTHNQDYLYISASLMNSVLVIHMLHNDQKLFLLVFLLYLTVKISAVTLTPLFPYSNYQSSIECVCQYLLSALEPAQSCLL